MPLPPHHVHISDLPFEHRFENAAGESTYHRTGMISEQGMVCWLHLDNGFNMDGFKPDKHFHPNDMTLYCISGRCRIVLNGTDEYILEKDDAIYVPPNVPHWLDLIDDEPCYLMEVFAPVLNHYLYLAEHQTAAVGAPRLPDGSRQGGWRQDGTHGALDPTLVKQSR